MAKKEKAEPFSMSDEEKMWKDNVLGESNPEQLLNTVIYLLGVHLSLCADDEHKALKTGYFSQIKVKFDEHVNAHFLEYQEVHSKNHQGLNDIHCKPKIVKAYANLVNPAHCVVRLFKKYLGLRPSHDLKCSHDLYLHPLKHYTEHV